MQNQPFDEAVELSESESVEEPNRKQIDSGMNSIERRSAPLLPCHVCMHVRLSWSREQRVLNEYQHMRMRVGVQRFDINMRVQMHGRIRTFYEI